MFVLAAMLLCTGAVAEVRFDETLSAFPVKTEDGWAEFALCLLMKKNSVKGCWKSGLAG